MTFLVFLQCLFVCAIAWRGIFEHGDFWLGVMLVALIVIEVWNRTLEDFAQLPAEEQPDE